MWRILRARRLSDTARATLGVAVTASQPEIKQAYRALAKEWHPDLHPGASKARRGEVQSHQAGIRGAGCRRSGRCGCGRCGAAASPAASRHRFRARRPQQSAAFTFTSYLGFRGRHGHSHWYEDTAHAAERVDAQRARRMWAGVGTFILGLAAINLSAARDRRLKASGDLVDAWFNQGDAPLGDAATTCTRTLSCRRRFTSNRLTQCTEQAAREAVGVPVQPGRSTARRQSIRTWRGSAATRLDCLRVACTRGFGQHSALSSYFVCARARARVCARESWRDKYLEIPSIPSCPSKHEREGSLACRLG